jgi:hypothetical protein
MKGGVSILVLLFAAVALSSTSCASRRHSQKMLPPVDPLEPEKSWSSQEGMEHLIAARTFAFGGVGIVGTTSDGEYAFRAILKNPEAPTLFKTAYTQATVEGQLYALCGIRATDRSSFDDFASPLRSETRDVATMSGRIATNEPIASVVKRIASGGYDQYFTNAPAAPAAGHPTTAR